MNKRFDISISPENKVMQTKIIEKFWPVASLVLVVFGSYSLFIVGDRISAGIDFFNLIVLSFFVPHCLRRGRVQLASNLLAGIGMITIFKFLFTAGPMDRGFWWSIVYVLGVFFVNKKKWAVFWVMFYFLISCLAVLFSIMGYVKVAYELPELLQLGFAYLITFVFVYYFNYVRESYLVLARRKSAELLVMNRELKAANKELEQLTYVASHDLQEPLLTISNFSGLLRREYKGKLGAEADQYLEFLGNASDKMKHLIKDVLDLSRVGQNSSHTRVDSKVLVQEILKEMQHLIQEKSAKVKVTELPKVKANRMELKLLFQNLISNAIKFHQPGKEPELEIFCEETEKNFKFSFKDNGIGLEEKHKDRIFVIFQRLHTNEEYPGTGIGLATCKKIVALHGGKIGLHSTPGKGSTFYFTLPRNNQ